MPTSIKSTLHTEGTMFATDGKIPILTRSGGCFGLWRVFELADGTIKAISVVTPEDEHVPPSSVDFGP